jgi:hypothetical protein
VLRYIGELEGARWAPTKYPEFRGCVVKLRAAALIAGANREALDSYIYLAQVAHGLSLQTWEMWDGEEEAGAGAIRGDLSTLVGDAARLLTESVWHPYQSRLGVRRGLADVKRAEAEMRADDSERVIWPSRSL